MQGSRIGSADLLHRNDCRFDFPHIHSRYLRSGSDCFYGLSVFIQMVVLGGKIMKIVVFKMPKVLSGITRMIFKMN